MIWNSVNNDERLRLWKNLRTKLTDLSLQDQLMEVAIFCSSIPYGSRTLDYYSPDDWPSPWEILYYSSFCTSSISLLMFYTLVMSDIDANIELYLVEDEDGIFLLPVIDNKFVLNYELGKISILSDIEDNLTVSKVYHEDQIKKIT